MFWLLFFWWFHKPGSCYRPVLHSPLHFDCNFSRMVCAFRFKGSMTQKHSYFGYNGKINGNISVISEILVEYDCVWFSICRLVQRPLQKPEYKKGGSIEPPFDHNHFYYSAKTTTLFFITSTVPPLTSNFISFPDWSLMRKVPFFKLEISGAWLFIMPKLPSLPGRNT